MNEQQKALEEGCLYISDLMEEKALSEKAVSDLLLFEAFTSQEFNDMIRELSSFAAGFPKQMTNTSEALRKAVESASTVSRNFLKKKASKQTFAQMASKVAGITKVLENSLDTVISGQKLSSLRRSVADESSDGQTSLTVGDTLDTQEKELLKMQIDQSFKAPGLLSRLFNKQLRFYGLDADGLYEDVIGLSLNDFNKLMNIETASLGDAITDDDLKQVASEAQPAEEDKADEKTTLPTASDVSSALKDKYKTKFKIGDDFADQAARATLDVLKSKGIKLESKFDAEQNIILERWRRMAGISQESDDE